MMVSVPLSADLLRRLEAGDLRDVAGFAATPSLFAALELAPDQEEDAEYAALTYASVECLRHWPRRCVAVAEVARADDARDDAGRVTVERLGLGMVQSLFVDEAPVAGLVAAAHREAATTPDLETAWDGEAVTALLAAADLLWYAPEERGDVLQMLED